MRACFGRRHMYEHNDERLISRRVATSRRPARNRHQSLTEPMIDLITSSLRSSKNMLSFDSVHARTIPFLCMMFVFAGEATAQTTSHPILKYHNAYRAKHCVPKMTWSNILADSARVWAKKCTFNHSLAADRPAQGENLAWGTAFSGKSSVALWYSEISKYNFAAPGPSDATLHFTQVVWRSSQRLGCVVAVCNGQNYWVCRYSPAGNNTNPGQYAQNVLPVCK